VLVSCGCLSFSRRGGRLYVLWRDGGVLEFVSARVGVGLEVVHVGEVAGEVGG
jgi:hypothetical protein